LFGAHIDYLRCLFANMAVFAAADHRT